MTLSGRIKEQTNTFLNDNCKNDMQCNDTRQNDALPNNTLQNKTHWNGVGPQSLEHH